MLRLSRNRNPIPWDFYRFGNYLLALAVLHDPLACRLFPHHLAPRFQSLSLPFRFHQSASPVLQYVSLLAGIISIRPSAFVEGGVLETPAHPKLFQGITTALVGCRSISFGRCARLLTVPPYSIFAGLLHCFRLFPSVFLAPCGSPARNQSILPLSTIL